MSTADSKNYQLRVRITSEERELLEKLCAERNSGETLSDLVREAISLLIKGAESTGSTLTPTVQARVERLAVLLKREPRQVEDACVEGILDLIEHKCQVPLIVMETQLHLKYRGKDNKDDFPWAPAPANDVPPPTK